MSNVLAVSTWCEHCGIWHGYRADCWVDRINDALDARNG